MRLVMDAIWNSVQLASHTHPSLLAAASVTDSTHPTTVREGPRNGRFKSSKAARKLDMGEEGSSTSLPTEGTTTSGNKGGGGESLKNKLYRNLVLDKLHEAKVYISLIYPLNYRLEILENMFSLLFLTSDEIKQPKLSEGVDSSAMSPQVGVASLHKADSFSSAGNGMDGVPSLISSIALIKSQHTFLVDEGVASDLLDMLRDCIFELRTDKFQLTQQKETATSRRDTPPDSSPTTAVKSSVPHTSLHPRSSKLEQFVNEARWRLRLVSSKYGITASASPALTAKVKGQPVVYDLFSSSDESVFELSDSEEEKKEKKETRKRAKKTTSSETREKEAGTSRTTPTQDIVSEGKSPNVIGSGSEKLPFSQLSSPAPRPRSIAPKHRRSVSPAPKSRPGSSSSGQSSKLKVSKGISRGSRHTSPSSSAAQSQNSSGGAKNVLSPAKVRDDSCDYAADVEEKSPVVSVSRKKRLKSRSSQTNIRKKRQRKSERSESGGFSKNSVVCKMLSSPGSLLRMCLRHGNYNKAREVVKLFNMEGQFGEACVNFSEDFEQVSIELSRRSQSGNKVSRSGSRTSSSLTQNYSTTPSKGKQPEETRRNFSSDTAASSHTNLQEAILVATSNSGPLDSLHRLLAPSSISKMLFSGDEHLEKVAMESPVLRGLSDHVPSLIMLDLICSGRVEGQIAKRIIELAVSRSQDILQNLHSRTNSLRRVKSHSSVGTTEGTLGGPFTLLHTFYEVAGHFVSPGAQQQGVVQRSFVSPHSLLAGLLHQLDVGALTHSKSYEDSLWGARERLETVIGQKQLELSSSTSEILVELSSAGGSSPEPSSTQKKANITLFDAVIRAVGGTPDFISMPPSASLSAKDRCLMRRLPSAPRLAALEDIPGNHHGIRYAYVRQFSRYLVKLVDLLVKCLGVSKSESHRDMLLISVLREGPSHLLGWLVFEQGIQPQRLETMMADFPQLRIVDVLVKCCCPQLPSNAAFSRPGKSPPHISVGYVSSGELDPPLLLYMKEEGLARQTRLYYTHVLLHS